MKATRWMALALGLVAAPALATSERAVEDQTPTGKFLTATEVRPILEATKGNWIAVREFNGQDLLYFTHLISWRCGLYEIHFRVNGGPTKQFPINNCDPETHMVGSVPENALIYLEYPLGSIQTIEVDLLYDDLGTATETFERKNVMTP